MAEHRPFPPSPRRRAAAHAAGLAAASPILVGAGAAAIALGALVAIGGSLARHLGAAIADACAGRASLAPAELANMVLALALPVLGAAAIAALAAHLAQTRAIWFPRRRRVPGAPSVSPARVQRAAFELASAAAIGAVAFGWLWISAPRIANLVATTDRLAAAGALLANAAAALLVAWLALGALDALARTVALRRALAMTSAEQREDARLAGADPRWRRARDAAARTPNRADSVATAALLVLGDGAAVAIAWDALRRPIPTRVATGRDARATQLLAHARRYRVPVHRDAALAAALVDHDGPIPELHWARLAALFAATRAR